MADNYIERQFEQYQAKKGRLAKASQTILPRRQIPKEFL